MGNGESWTCQLLCFLETQDIYHCSLCFFSLWKTIVFPPCQALFLRASGDVSSYPWPLLCSISKESHCTLKVLSDLFRMCFFLTDNYHKDKILQLFSPAVQNNLLLKVLLKVNSNQLISAKHCVNSGVVILWISKPAKQNTSSESILPFQNF